VPSCLWQALSALGLAGLKDSGEVGRTSWGLPIVAMQTGNEEDEKDRASTSIDIPSM
jgi:hypothetical protein